MNPSKPENEMSQVIQQWTTRDPVSNQVVAKDQQLWLFSEFYTCAIAHTYMHTHHSQIRTLTFSDSVPISRQNPWSYMKRLQNLQQKARNCTLLSTAPILPQQETPEMLPANKGHKYTVWVNIYPLTHCDSTRSCGVYQNRVSNGTFLPGSLQFCFTQ